MILYLVRHAEAVKSTKSLPDEGRYLTEAGRKATKKLRSKMLEKLKQPDLVVVSPLVRAVQTAEIIVEKYRSKTVIIVNEVLRPESSVGALIKFIKLNKKQKCMMLVGHEPLLGALLLKLIGSEDASLALDKPSCVIIKINKSAKAKFTGYISKDRKSKKRMKGYLDKE